MNVPFNLLLSIKDAFVYIHHVISKNVALRSPPLDKNKKKVRCHNMVPNFSLLCFSSTVQQHTILHISFFFFFFFALPISQKKEHHPF